MAGQNELQIVLSLVDDASASLKKVKDSLSDVKKPLNDIRNEGEKSNKSLQDGFKDSATHARAFRRDLMMVTGVLVGIVGTTREYAKYNSEARKSVDEFDLAVQQMSYNVGKALTPVLNLLAMSAKGWAMIANLVSNVATGKGFVLTDEQEVTNIIRAEQELRNLAETQKQTANLFMTGRMDAETYYQTLIGAEDQLMMARKMGMDQMNELAQLTMQVRSSEIMEAQRSTNEQVALLNFYKQNYAIAHAGMKAITVELATSIRTNLSAALSDIILGAKTAHQAFTEFGKALLKTIVDFMVQKTVAWLLEKTLLAGTVASSTAAGSAVAAAWAPAAAMVSLATLGANAAPAAAGIVTVNILSVGLAKTAPAAKAFGGDEIVRRPTLFLAGENGPERAIFQPLGGTSGGGGGGTTNINIYNPIVSSRDAIGELADVISERLARETERI